jgi:hypothetical protein
MRSFMTHLGANWPLSESAYSGNIGIMEMMKFYRVATEQEKDLMKSYLDKDEYDKAWDLLKKVTGVKLQDYKR